MSSFCNIEYEKDKMYVLMVHWGKCLILKDAMFYESKTMTSLCERMLK